MIFYLIGGVVLAAVAWGLKGSSTPTLAAQWHVLRPATIAMPAASMTALLDTKKPLLGAVILGRSTGEQIYASGPVVAYGKSATGERTWEISLQKYMGIDVVEAGYTSKGLVPSDAPAVGTHVVVTDADLVTLTLQ